jgi:hypothetical protein
MQPVAEPAGDIRAQLAAVMDPSHPKAACFVVPQDAHLVPLVLNAFIEARPEGTLVTTDEALADLFRYAPDDPYDFDRTMAQILGYPEDKALVVSRCRGAPAVNARAVQARDAGGHVICETFASPIGFLGACEAMAKHVPPGGQLVTIGAVIAISRRIAMRWLDV